jgi:hypothetical protein
MFGARDQRVGPADAGDGSVSESNLLIYGDFVLRLLRNAELSYPLTGPAWQPPVT